MHFLEVADSGDGVSVEAASTKANDDRSSWQRAKASMTWLVEHHGKGISRGRGLECVAFP